MTSEVRLWMVERTYDSRNLVTIIYATTDGEQYHQKELSSTMLSRTDVTAAVDVSPEKIGAVGDRETQKRYAQEATRMADAYAPDETV